MTMAGLPIWPGWHRMPAPPRIRWSLRAREAIRPTRPMPPLPELLWRGTGPAEMPLVVPALARHVIPSVAEALDAGYELRRNAGPPDGKN